MAGLLKKIFKNWGVVQSAERLTVNQKVAGSSPAAPATHHKGENMSTKESKEIRAELSSLRMRISGLVDEVSNLKSDVKRFKENVANDVKYLTERVDN